MPISQPTYPNTIGGIVTAAGAYADSLLPDYVPINATTATTVLDMAGKRTRYFRVFAQTNTAISWTNVPTGVVSYWSLELVQDATGGRVVTLPTPMLWEDGIIPAVATGPNAFSQYEFWNNGVNSTRAALVLRNGSSV
jgi:hypothetical protein